MIYLETYTYQFTCKYDKIISDFLSFLYKYFFTSTTEQNQSFLPTLLLNY